MKKIAIIPNETKDIALNVTKVLVNFLKDKATLVMEEKFSKTGFDICFSDDKLFSDTDYVIIIGGDGTMLSVAEPCGKYNIPVMGINMGTIGFMTEVETDDMLNAALKLLSGDFKIETRMMMDVKIQKSSSQIASYTALNDIVLAKSDTAMISVELYSDDNKINEYTADGLIIASPTGSTGYSLSAGGPVAEPCMELFIASPICAHMLGSRPALLPPDKNIILKLKDPSASVTIDGNLVELVSDKDNIIISKSKYTYRIIKMSNHSFYDVLINKLS